MAFITSKNGSRQPLFLIATGILLLLSTIVVSLRLYCRVSGIRHVGLDDYFTVAALVLAIAMGIQNGFLVSWGTGFTFRDNFDPDSEALASILALYHRIFTQGRFKYAVYSVAAFVTIYTIVVFFVNACECRDPSRAWAPTFPQGCNDLTATYFSTASINILTDVMILFMPLRAFDQLNLHRKKRHSSYRVVALGGVFLVGGIAVIASIIEVNVAIISASIPALRPFFKKTFPSSSYNQCSKYGTGYDRSGGPCNIYCAPRSRSNGQMEPHSISGNESSSEHRSIEREECESNGEEYVLQTAGITKTVNTSVKLGTNHGDERLQTTRSPC
ncbi:hypothetical protein DE146DRAFT_777143 [Phaeosphaeria sp. MPI-PUGE-AT-0046c]|nr:hypothetical protein DE146DRAFT_777143 [Phaeosphaeria sp. MPI-PUGE-AT-0046c]